MSCAPSISVILPVYNGATTLRSALESLQQQSEKCFEVLIINNGSTDGSESIALNFAAGDERFKLRTLPAANLVAALNCGLELSKGSFVARMDCDDWSYPERLQKQREYLEKSPTVSVLSSLVDFGGDRRASGGYARYVDWINSLVQAEQISRGRFIESPLAHPSVMCRKQSLKEAGGWREGDFPEDYELWLRLLERGCIIEKLPEVLLRWNDPKGRLSRVDQRYSTAAFYRIKAEYLARHLSPELLCGRDLYVWGAGRDTRRRANILLEHGLSIKGWVDVDPKKCGKTVAAVPVITEEQLPSPERSFVLSYVASWGARAEISALLQEKGYREGFDYLLAA